MGLSGNRLGQQGFTRAGRAHQQRALGQSGADLGISARIVQEVHHFHQRFFGLVLSRHIRKGDAGFLLYIYFRVALAHSHGTAAAAHSPKQETQQYPYQHQRQYQRHQNLHDPLAHTGGYAIDLHPVFQGPLRHGLRVLDLQGLVLNLYGLKAVKVIEFGSGLIHHTVLQRETDGLAAEFHGLDLIRIHPFHKGGIRNFHHIAAFGEENRPQHGKEKKTGQYKRQYHHNAGTLGFLVIVLAAVPAGSRIVAAASRAAVIIIFHMIIHKSLS